MSHDSLSGGLERGEFAVISAKTDVGKSKLAEAIMQNSISKMIDASEMQSHVPSDTNIKYKSQVSRKLIEGNLK